MQTLLENVQSLAKERQPVLTGFAQQLISIPSLPGQENEVADIIHNEMLELGYDEVWVDHAGNIIGKINGGDGPSIYSTGIWIM